MPPKQSARIYQQIEEAADFYEPELYSLLGTFDVKTEPDPNSLDFIPLTGATVLPKSETKMFVIGLLPPSVKLTMKLLNRAASIQSRYGSGQTVDVETREFTTPAEAAAAADASGKYVTMPGAKIPGPDSGKGDPSLPGVGYKTSGNSNSEVPVVTKLTQAQVYKAIYDAWVRRYKSQPSPNAILLLASQTWRETGGLWPNNNPGMIGNYIEGSKTRPPPPTAWSTRHIQAGGDRAFYISYDSIEAGADAFLAHATRGTALAALRDSDAMGYNTSLAATAYYGATVKSYYDKSRAIYVEMGNAVGKAGGPVWPPFSLPPAPDTCAFNETQAGYQKRVGCAKGHCPEGVDAQRFKVSGDKVSSYEGCSVFGTSPASPDAPTSKWDSSGASNAQKASKDVATRDGTELPGATAMAQSLEAAQGRTIQALADAIRRMAETPPLRMLVNPESFKVSEEKVIADGSWSRAGPIVEHWGENQPTLSASGRVAGFYALDINAAGVGSPGNSPGLTRTARNFSMAYQNLLSLYFIYKNNGAVFIPEEFTGNATRQVMAMLGSVYIYYDNTLYVGSFSSLNLQESDDKPFSLQYDFEFSVRAAWLLDRQVDPRATYGDKPIFAKDLGEVTTSSNLFNPADITVAGAMSSDSAEGAVPLPTTPALDQEATTTAAPPVVEPENPDPDFGKMFHNKPAPVDRSVSSVIATRNDRARYERTVSSTKIPYIRTKK